MDETKLREALKAARHALATAQGLWAHDGKQGQREGQFQMDFDPEIAAIDEAIADLKKEADRPPYAPGTRYGLARRRNVP